MGSAGAQGSLGVSFSAATSNGHAGGGGGGAGYITVHTASGTFTNAGGAVVSPQATVGVVGKR
jgi:hypothetical protein